MMVALKKFFIRATQKKIKKQTKSARLRFMKLTAGGPKPPQAQLNNNIKFCVKQIFCGKIQVKDF